MLRDGIILEDDSEKVVFNQYSFCELVKYILIGCVKITYENATKLVDTSPLSRPVNDVMTVALLSHEYAYYWAMLLYYGNNYWEQGIPAQPEDLKAHFEYESYIQKKYHLKEPFEWK